MKPEHMTRDQLNHVASQHEEAMYRLRKSIGLIGFFLPFLLLAGVWLFNVEMQISISRFFFTEMRDIFVLSLAGVGVFLINYHGHDPENHEFLSDWLVSTIAGVTVLGVALIPTLCDGDCYRPLTLIDSRISADGLQSSLHFGAAGFFLICLAIFCLKLFTKSNVPPDQWSPDKKLRNRIYRICGWIILAMVALLLGFKFLLPGTGAAWDAGWNFTFWAESVAVWAFGVSWLVKGEALRGRPTTFLYGADS